MTSTPLSHILIRASAGTGKTYQLTNRYLGLLVDGVLPEHILATTFTRKAAGEILDRILVRLARAATDPAECDKLGEALQRRELTTERCLKLLASFVQQLHRVRVSTLDAIFAQIAGSFCLEIGLPLGWRIVEPIEMERLRDRALEAVLVKEDSNEVNRLLHLMTKGEADRSVAELLQGTVETLYGVYCETDEQAWKCLPRGNQLLSDEARGEVIEAAAQVPLPKDAKFINAVERSLQLARRHDWVAFVQDSLVGKVIQGEEKFNRKAIPDALRECYQKLVAHGQSVLREQLRNQTEATYELLRRFDTHFQQLKRQARALRFEDITRWLARSISDLDVEQVDYRLDAPIDHLLLDEFQDTSPAQWQVLQPIADRVTSRRGAESDGDELPQGARSNRYKTSFFCVGDVKQAIYGWRGGRAAIFEAVERRLQNLKTCNLAESRRSSPPVIEAVNAVFENLLRHPASAEWPAMAAWARQYQTHTTALSHLPGYAVLETCGDPSANDDDEQDANEIRTDACDGDSPTTASQLATRRVAEYLERMPHCGIGVLVRSNKMVARMIFELRAAGIDASEEGGNPLTDSAPVTAVLSLLRLADHPGDGVSRFHVAHSPLGQVVGLTDTRSRRTANRVSRDIRRRLLVEGYGPVLRDWVARIAPDATPRDRNRLRQLVDAGYVYEDAASLRPGDFVSLIERQRAADPTSAPVRVMTIHQAKGLQFDVVILPDLASRLIGQPPAFVVRQPDPTRPIDCVSVYRNKEIQALLPPEVQVMFEQSQAQMLSESLCVLYVAMTRAVHALHMIIPPSKDNERTLPKTQAGLLRAALTEGKPVPPETQLRAFGDAEWWRRVERQEAPATVERTVPHIEFARGPRSVAQRTAPSRLEGSSRVRMGELLGRDARQALERGSFVHLLFEQVRWLEDGVPADEQLAAMLRAAGAPEELAAELLTEFHGMLNRPAIQEVLRRETYVANRSKRSSRGSEQGTSFDVANERRISIITGDRWLAGAIDRLVLERQDGRVVAAEIFDYKTDSLNANDAASIEERVAFYRPQQEAYREAVAAMYRLELERVDARLIFVVPGIVTSVQ